MTVHNFTENFLTDDILKSLLHSGTLSSTLAEIIPPLGHRLQIQGGLGRKWPLENIAVTVNSSGDIELATHDTSEVPIQVKCTICKNTLPATWADIWWHLKYQHLLLQRYLNWKCLFCEKSLLRFVDFKSHINKHLDQYLTNSSLKSPSVLENEPLDSNVSPEIETSNPDASPKIEAPAEFSIPIDFDNLILAIKKKAVKFVVQLKSSGRLSLSICNEIISNISQLFNDVVNFIGKFTCSEVNDLPNYLDQLRNPFEMVKSDYLLQKYLTDTGYFIKPEEVVLGSRLATVKLKSQVKFDKYHYVPITKVLEKVLAMPGVMRSILEVNNDVQNGVLSSPVSGNLFRNLILQSRIPVVLILFYYDELEVCNPLGSRRGVHKLGNCYYSILNAAPQHASQLENIFLCCSFKTKLLQSYPISKILAKTVSEFSELSQNPIFIKSDSYEGEVKIVLGQVTGDNLGLHQVFGFTESFVSNYPCRFCILPRYRCLTLCTENNLFRRNIDNYQTDLELKTLSLTGIKTSSIFNDIPNFHVTKNVCPDIMHDVLEGVAPINIKLMLQKILSSGSLTLEQINFRITSFNYQHLQKDCPNELSERMIMNSDSLLGLSAGQTFTLLQSFCLIFADQFCENDTHWELFLIFMEIMDIIMSPVISAQSLSYLKVIISDHHFLYQKLTNKCLRPKHHHMLHYPAAIKQIGPLHYYWAMRFEARHKFFKHVAKIGCNFKNITGSVSTRNQLLLSYRLIENKGFSIETYPISEEIFAKIEIGNLFDFLPHVNPNDPISRFDRISVKGLKISVNDYLAIDFESCNELPLFGQVIAIIRMQDIFRILFKYQKTLSFSKHYNAYKVEESEKFDLKQVEEIDLLKPLLHVKSPSFFISLPYK